MQPRIPRTPQKVRHSVWLSLLRGLVTVRRKLRHWLSRREWSVRLLRLWKSPEPGDQPGLVLIQIDGLSRSQFEQALARGHMSFLRRLLEQEGYEIKTLYSGIPSTTPAVQGELFYGVKTAVPAFGFREKRTGQLVRMIDTDSAMRREKELSQHGEGLLHGGSSYSNIYSGGAIEPHFCPAVMGWGNFLNNTTLPRSLLVILWNAMAIFRTMALSLIEFFLAIADAFRGAVAGRSLWEELKFVPSRVVVGVLLREFIAIGGEIDATRGLPIIHANFLGYDEQAHRRGPNSAFAHWSLRQIDKSIQRICDAAFCSTRRDYQVWIYSDHGQERTRPYFNVRGKTLQDVILDISLAEIDKPLQSRSAGVGIESQRAHWLGGGFLQRLLPKIGLQDWLYETGLPVVADQGPLAHIYWPQVLSDPERNRVAERLVEEQNIPLVFAVDDDNSVVAWNREGRFQLPCDAAKIFGKGHPFLQEVAQDWVSLCRHPEAGDLVVSGWSRTGESFSFVMENGAHAGPGPEETRAFVLLPGEAPLPERKHEDFFRPLDLRRMAQRVLHRGTNDKKSHPQPIAKESQPSLRIMTYNVHSCIGMDGKLSPRRIARVIAQTKPDIIALQELDVGRSRTGGQDQAHLIARELAMEFHFHAALQVEEEQYGNAILSRFPLRLIQAGPLTLSKELGNCEPRGAIWVTMDWEGEEVQIINTHLGLSRRERREQIQTLFGADWLGDPRCTDPVVLCGDFNAGPSSLIYREITRALDDAQTKFSQNKPQQTWSSTWPVRRIDHVFLRGAMSVSTVDVPRNRLVRVASDPRPLVVELTRKSSADQAKEGEQQKFES